MSWSCGHALRRPRAWTTMRWRLSSIVSRRLRGPAFWQNAALSASKRPGFGGRSLFAGPGCRWNPRGSVRAPSRGRAPGASAPFRFDLELPAGVTLTGTWQRPPSTEASETKGLRPWTDSLQFQASLGIPSGLSENSELVLRLHYQVCDDSMCLPPAKEAQTLRLK